MVNEVDRLSGQHGRRGLAAIVSTKIGVYGTARVYLMLSEQHQTVAVFRVVEVA